MEPGENQSVAKITRKLGDNRFSVELPDKRVLVAKLRGALRKTRLDIGDFVVVETVLNLSVIVYKYDVSDAKYVRKTYFTVEENSEEDLFGEGDDDDEKEEDEINIDDI
jgi:translation initiation factor IF-1